MNSESEFQLEIELEHEGETAVSELTDNCCPGV